MNIYLIENDIVGYDIYNGHVIVANSEQEVRQLAKRSSADEGKDVWNYAEITLCGKYTGLNTKPFILLSDFAAG